MADVNDLFGFELFQKLYHDDIHKKEDVIIMFVHWYLIKSGFRCIGVGDETAFSESEKGSELLPTEWNLHPNYTLRYVKHGKLHILFGIKSDMDLLLNFVRHLDNSIRSISFSIESTVSALHGPLEIVIPSYQTALQNIQTDLVKCRFSKFSTCSNEAATQTVASSNSSEGQMRHPHYPLMVGPSRRPLSDRPEFDPARVGARDLYPFGEGGGMIFDPYEDPMRRRPVGRVGPGGLGVPGVLPADAVPPGARFDPFGPPELDERPRNLHGLRQPLYRLGPDNDHLPIPGFDNMFQ